MPLTVYKMLNRLARRNKITVSTGVSSRCVVTYTDDFLHIPKKCDELSVVINDELELYLPLYSVRWIGDWEIMDYVGGKLQSDGEGGLVPSMRGQIMRNYYAATPSQVYRRLYESYSEWIK